MALSELASQVLGTCELCGLCSENCSFLKKWGLPGDIARSVLNHESRTDPFECSLCSLCTDVCPVGVDPAGMFLSMRRESLTRSPAILRTYWRLLLYERLNSSALLSWYKPSRTSESVFFPGCALAGTRPDATWALFIELKRYMPGLGVVLDCCCRPSHDLGNTVLVEKSLQRMQERLHVQGVRQIITACPSCYSLFQVCAPKLSIRMAWEVLPGMRLAHEKAPKHKLRLHDSCALRFFPGVQTGIRNYLAESGLVCEEFPDNFARTLCCGEGGAVGFGNRDMALAWGRVRKDQAGDDLVLTYCAGCTDYLRLAGIKTVHLVDFLIHPEKALAGNTSQVKSPWTYWNRLRLKFRFIRGASKPENCQ